MCPPNVGTTYFHQFSLCGTPFGVGQTHGSAPTGGGLVTSETLVIYNFVGFIYQNTKLGINSDNSKHFSIIFPQWCLFYVAPSGAYCLARRYGLILPVLKHYNKKEGWLRNTFRPTLEGPCATRCTSIYKGFATFHIRCSRNCQ